MSKQIKLENVKQLSNDTKVAIKNFTRLVECFALLTVSTYAIYGAYHYKISTTLFYGLVVSGVIIGLRGAHEFMRSEVTHKTTKTKKAITITYTCTSCKHSFKDKMDLTSKEEKPDPDFDSDRIHFCLLDKEFRDRLFKMRHDFREMAELGKKFKEKEDNKYIYDAVKEMKQPKIAELVPLLSPILEKAGYIEFHLDKPEMGRDVYVGFSCLDNKSDREDYDSRKTLKKLVDSTLSDTNWRLMSDGISYRLGYLNGRVKAYEGEEALKELVIKSGKLNPEQTRSPATDKKADRTLKTPDGREVIL